jgi:hypothetical protein
VSINVFHVSLSPLLSPSAIDIVYFETLCSFAKCPASGDDRRLKTTTRFTGFLCRPNEKHNKQSQNNQSTTTTTIPAFARRIKTRAEHSRTWLHQIFSKRIATTYSSHNSKQTNKPTKQKVAHHACNR